MSTKRLSLNEIRTRVAKFVVDYKDAKAEKQNTSDFWKAFMRCYGVEDSYLQGVTFEYPARRSDTGGLGYVDVFLPGQYLIEQKSEGRISRPKLGQPSNAEAQAHAYLTGGDITPAQMPRWVITSDFATIQVTDLSEPRKSLRRTVTIDTRDLIDHVEAFLFLAGDDPDAMLAEEQAGASVAAARLMGDLYAAMTGDDDTDSSVVQSAEDEDAATMEASILLTRLLFLMFGDDAGLWKRGLFQSFIETRTAKDGSDLGAQLAALFDVLNRPEGARDKRMDEALREFPYVNGALYAGGSKMMWFDKPMRDALVAACHFDWSRISPAVFGSLFQTVKSKVARRSDGEHYTSEANILKVLRPLFLDDLRSRLNSADTKPALEKLHAEMKALRYVDPACGCGNFLVVAYREMRAIELDLLAKLQGLRGKGDDLIMDPSDMLNVRLDQFYGIELNWWPAKIAETAMFLVDHQANQRMSKTLGLTPLRLPIEISARIHHANALTTDWPGILPSDGERVFVFGNPPFLGRAQRSDEQKRELLDCWGIKRAGHLDFVTAWHAKSLSYLKGRIGDFAFVTTNSITQGEPVAELFPRIEMEGWRIKFAHRTFQWDSEASAKDKAAVHCVIIGFSRDAQAKPRLFDYATPRSDPFEVPVPTGELNGYLIEAPRVYVERRKGAPVSPELPQVGYGSMPNDGGFLIVEPDAVDAVRADPVASKYLRRFVGADELIHNKERWCLWLVDLDPSDVGRSSLLKARLEAVRDARLASKNPDTWPHAKTPHLFWFINQPSVPYLCMPQVFSESRIYATAERLPADVIASNKVYTCPDPDGFAFGIISSSMFMAWQRAIGGKLKSDMNFSGTGAWNNLPLPAVTPALRRAIVEAGTGVLVARERFPARSLADHYNPLAMDQALVQAHDALDKVVDKAFGAGRGRMSLERRQMILFERFMEMTGARPI